MPLAKVVTVSGDISLLQDSRAILSWLDIKSGYGLSRDTTGIFIDLEVSGGLIFNGGKLKVDDIFVKLSGDQTINGIKSFGSIPVLPNSDPTTANQAIRKQYVDSLTTNIIFKDVSSHNISGQTTETSATSFTIPANTLGTNRGLRIRLQCSGQGNQSGQSLTIKLGSTAILSGIALDSNGKQVFNIELFNNNNASAQVGSYFTIHSSTRGYDTGDFTSSVNTALDQLLDIRINNGNSSNQATLSLVSVELLRS
jgi:hypothetical protein